MKVPFEAELQLKNALILGLAELLLATDVFNLLLNVPDTETPVSSNGLPLFEVMVMLPAD